nr:TPA_asm: M25 uORF 3 RNA *1 [Murid betaherpesvirus 1]DBA07746.1 TPA_asm: M25 uORF 3 RNA *1 [Murid betaherpesvirus 1]
MASSGGPR